MLIQVLLTDLLSMMTLLWVLLLLINITVNSFAIDDDIVVMDVVVLDWCS